MDNFVFDRYATKFQSWHLKYENCSLLLGQDINWFLVNIRFKLSNKKFYQLNLLKIKTNNWILTEFKKKKKSCGTNYERGILVITNVINYFQIVNYNMTFTCWIRQIKEGLVYIYMYRL